MMVMTMKQFWHYITVWFLLDSSSQHNSICGAKEQITVDIHPFRGRVMRTKLHTTAYQADAQYAALSN